MLKIRLRRMGSTHSPFYRLVVSDSRKRPEGAAVDEVGYYNPTVDPIILKVDQEKVEHWVGRGAQLSPTVRKLVRQYEEPSAEESAAETEASAEPAAAEAAAAEPAAEAAAEAAPEPAAEAAPEAAEEAEATPADEAS
ncbi:MAG: 30S ribosomal protein S16 [Acidobacteriota bacterium]